MFVRWTYDFHFEPLRKYDIETTRNGWCLIRLTWSLPLKLYKVCSFFLSPTDDESDRGRIKEKSKMRRAAEQEGRQRLWSILGSILQELSNQCLLLPLFCSDFFPTFLKEVSIEDCPTPGKAMEKPEQFQWFMAIESSWYMSHTHTHTPYQATSLHHDSHFIMLPTWISPETEELAPLFSTLAKSHVSKVAIKVQTFYEHENDLHGIGLTFTHSIAYYWPNPYLCSILCSFLSLHCISITTTCYIKSPSDRHIYSTIQPFHSVYTQPLSIQTQTQP